MASGRLWSPGRSHEGEPYFAGHGAGYTLAVGVQASGDASTSGLALILPCSSSPHYSPSDFQAFKIWAIASDNRCQHGSV